MKTNERAPALRNSDLMKEPLYLTTYHTPQPGTSPENVKYIVYYHMMLEEDKLQKKPVTFMVSTKRNEMSRSYPPSHDSVVAKTQENLDATEDNPAVTADSNQIRDKRSSDATDKAPATADTPQES